MKQRAADAALEHVTSNSVVGLGSGSTAALFIAALGDKLKAGTLTGIRGIPTSEDSDRLARENGIELTGFKQVGRCDLTVDGADEIAPDLSLVKGLGGALLREKIVAQNSARLIIIADAGKRVDKLGTKSPLPVEVTKFGLPATIRFLEGLNCKPVVRDDDGQPFVTDNGNLICDCHFDGGIYDPDALADTLAAQAGVVEHGLFLGLAERALIATPDGVDELE